MTNKIVTLFVITLFGIFSLSCGNKSKPQWLTEPTNYESSVGPMRIFYKNPDDTAFVGSFDKPEAERRVELTLEIYQKDHNWTAPIYPLWIYPTLISGLPCGVPNGGGCASALRLSITGSTKAFYHELNHLRLLQAGDPNWTSHTGKEWEKVWVWDAKSDEILNKKP